MSGDVNGGEASPGEAQLTISGVSKHFGGVRAVEAVTLSVRAGELISVIGPNGAGKTSLLNMISGFYRPDTGAIVFAGKDITGARPSHIAALGIARLHADAAANEMLGRIQNDLFDLGADLCTPGGGRRGAGALRIAAAQIERLEREIDAMNATLAPLDSFVLPGGTAAAAHLHLARTVTRRAERLVSELAGAERVNPEALKYLNRLSDHLFVLSRRVNNDGALDVLWRPGANR